MEDINNAHAPFGLCLAEEGRLPLAQANPPSVTDYSRPPLDPAMQDRVNSPTLTVHVQHPLRDKAAMPLMATHHCKALAGSLASPALTHQP